MRLWPYLQPLVLLCSLVLGQDELAAPRQASHAKQGETAREMQFEGMLRSDGRKRLSEYRGQPVLLALYSTVFGGLLAAKGAIKLHDEFGEQGLAVLLMEDQKNDETYIEALMLSRLPGTTCPLLQRQFMPFLWDPAHGPPPMLALIGIDGSVLYAGSYQGMSKIEKLVESELKRLRKGWGMDPDARQVRALAFGKHALGAARLRLDELHAEFPFEQAADPEMYGVACEVDWRYGSWLRSIRHLADDGRPGEALQAARTLVDATHGYPDWEAEASASLEALMQPGPEEDRALEAKLLKILRPLRSKPPREELPKKLARFAELAGASATGKRALRIAAAAELAIQGLD